VSRTRATALIDRWAFSSYRVPTPNPEADGTLSWDATTVVVVELSAEGLTGTGWTYGAGACQALLEEQAPRVLHDADAMQVASCREAFVREARNLGRPGVVAGALSALDIALWDLKARLLDLPLATLFGRCREEVPLYGSGGFITYDEALAASELEHFVAELGMARVKIKIGESWGHNEVRDLARIAFARSVIGDTVELFVDANGAYARKQAVRVGQRAAAFGVSWFEEPVSSDDLRGLHEIRAALDLDIAAGEYGYGEWYFANMAGAEAVDCLQVDVTRCGGYTSFLRAAAIAAGHGLEISAHCAPNLHVPVALAVPNLRHVEYFRDHERTDALLFEGTEVPVDGLLRSNGSPGHGFALRRDAPCRIG
jgi:L-alanine-DL-glutamate epimerase-like enolase superfamily enzyme